MAFFFALGSAAVKGGASGAGREIAEEVVDEAWSQTTGCPIGPSILSGRGSKADNIADDLTKKADDAAEDIARKNNDKIVPTNVDDILGEATPGRITKGKTVQYVKPGGVDAANTDFDALAPTNVRDINTQYGSGRTGTLPDGRIVTVRPGSSDGRPTLEIRRPNGRGEEIRYN